MSLQYPRSLQIGAILHQVGATRRQARATLHHPRATLRHPRDTLCHPRESGGMTVREAGMTEESVMTVRLPASRSRTVGNIRRKCGFTLLEVMIALLVITLGMGAVIVTTGESAWKSSHLRESTIASWVAYNEIALYRAKRTWSEATSRSGEAEMANAQWKWK